MIFYYDILENYNPENVLDVNEAFTFYSDFIFEIEDVVHDMAKDYMNNHDGWEHDQDSWPLTFCVWNDKKEHVGDYSVDLEYEPTFYVNKIEN